MSISEWVLRDDHEGITTLTLNTPETLNTLSENMMTALYSHVTNIAEDPSVRVVIVRGEGQHFCAGHDLKEMSARRGDPDGGLDYFQTLFQTCSTLMLRITQLPQPVIAEVSGIATAAGCQLVASCDLAVASEDAEFATSGINIGLFCATPMVALSRTIARKHALEMLLTGEFINAQRAAMLGLVNRVVPRHQLADSTRELAATIARQTPVAIKMGKRAYYQQAAMNLKEAYTLASETMACNMMAMDTEAGIEAFINKQPMPEWSGE